MADNLFENIKENYPELLKSKHLIELGLYSGDDAAWFARRDGIAPPYIRIKTRILYPRAGVINFLEKKLVKRNDKEEVGHASSSSVSS